MPLIQLTNFSTANLQDRDHVLDLSQHCQAHSILTLVCSILGLPNSPVKRQPVLGSGRLSQAWLRSSRHQKLILYLLLMDHPGPVTSAQNVTASPGLSDINLSEPRFRSLCDTTTNFLTAEVAAILQTRPASEPSDIPAVNGDVIRSTLSLCLVTLALLSNSRISRTGKQERLLDHIRKLRASMGQTILLRDGASDLVDVIMLSVGSYLPPLACMSENHGMLNNGAVAMTELFSQTFWQQLQSTESANEATIDYMEIEESFESQGSHSRVDKTPKEISHDEIAAATDHMSLRASLIAKFCLISTIRKTTHNGGCAPGVVPLSFIKYITTLDGHQFLACRPFFKELFSTDLHIDVQGSVILLEFLGKNILELYDMERCEVSLGLCLDVMTGLADTWTATDEGEFGSNLYEWFIKVALGRGISSPHVHICISSMLQRVIKVQPEYARSLSLPSARTSLFQILEEGVVAVKYRVGLNISDIFGLFILKEHDAILGDIINSLPSERDWIEGIALRLLILAHLASSWSTLLRRCIYAMFETPGHVPDSINHAKHCVKHVASSLNLANSQELFKLFVSQITYTWLELQPLRSIPYAIFGYDDLKGLLEDVQEEVTGQVAMRGIEDEAFQLSQDLALPYEKLLEASFTKSAAYCIARDAAVAPAHNAQIVGTEVRLRKRLGKEIYLTLVVTNFSRVLAQFFKSMDQVEQIKRGFQKHENYSLISQTYDEMLEFGAATTVLPVSQQPSFKASYLISEIEYLCQRSNYDAKTIWTPALFVYVFRELLNTIHDALGSLHACSVIRRIRILICMAGKTALYDYPLEMALHALRPFLTDTHCAEDAISIYHYLIAKGAEYLAQVPPFLAGLAVSTLASMKRFLNMPQESTTQESQFRATMSKAQNFHLWLTMFLDNYSSPYLIGPSYQSFKAITEAAGHVSNAGNARKGTYESDLLLALLDDQHSGGKLINLPSRDLILGMLCSSFEAPESYHDNILDSDEQAAVYAHVVWRAYKRGNYGEGYRLWAGRVLGRAYGGTGIVDSEMLREVYADSLDLAEVALPPGILSFSQSRILKRLSDILSTDDRIDVGVSERTLQRITSNLEATESNIEFESLFQKSLLTSLSWAPYHCPVEHLPLNVSETLHDPLVLDVNVHFDIWIRRLCIALIDSVADDPILSALRPVLHVVKKLPEQVFPYVLHLVLLREANKQQIVKRILSDASRTWFNQCSEASRPHVRLFLRAVLYLRSQPLPHETTETDRSTWLDIDFTIAAEAATACRMFKTALLFLEISFSGAAKASRRTSSHRTEEPTELLLYVFENVGDKDSVYGIRQPSSLYSMMTRLEYENAGFKSLSFRGAYLDSQIRLLKNSKSELGEGLIKVLDNLDLNGLSQSLLSKLIDAGPLPNDTMLRTARKLEQWDISSPVDLVTEASTIFSVFQDLHSASNIEGIRNALNHGFSKAVNILEAGNLSESTVYSTLSSLAVLSEIDEVVSVRGVEQLQETWSKLEARNKWMVAETYFTTFH